MGSARRDRGTFDSADRDGRGTFRAVGSVITFDGFLKLYREDLDDAPEDDEGEGRILPAVGKGDAMAPRDVKGDPHFTQPPPRFTEASLVKKMEEAGIGRTSTYPPLLKRKAAG